MSAGVKIAVSGGAGLALGIVVSLATAVPFAPEAGLILGLLGGWLATRS